MDVERENYYARNIVKNFDDPDPDDPSPGGRSAGVVRLLQLCSDGKRTETEMLHPPQLHNIVRTISKLVPETFSRLLSRLDETREPMI